tara:strand:+ start:150872 stop:151723 length:852 start_codon:yes stop_codon:yes gene_type:complete
MTIETVGIVGCGLMGSGITQVCAQAGYRTIVMESSENSLELGMGRINNFLSRDVSKDKLTNTEKVATLDRITSTTKYEDLASCDLVIEAVTENLNEKKLVFQTIDSIAPPHAILASNTSSISITELAAETNRPQSILGLHFFNPVPIMRLIEMVVGLQTNKKTIEIGRHFGKSLAKEVIETKDTPGFIVNYLLIPYLLDAVRLVESEVATKEDIDAGMILGCEHPLGPLKLLDFIGLDTTLYIADVLLKAFNSDRYSAPPLLRKMVAAGITGRKSGQGFYKYN